MTNSEIKQLYREQERYPQGSCFWNIFDYVAKIEQSAWEETITNAPHTHVVDALIKYKALNKDSILHLPLDEIKTIVNL